MKYSFNIIVIRLLGFLYLVLGLYLGYQNIQFLLSGFFSELPPLVSYVTIPLSLTRVVLFIFVGLFCWQRPIIASYFALAAFACFVIGATLNGIILEGSSFSFNFIPVFYIVASIQLISSLLLLFFAKRSN